MKKYLFVIVFALIIDLFILKSPLEYDIYDGIWMIIAASIGFFIAEGVIYLIERIKHD